MTQINKDSATSNKPKAGSSVRRFLIGGAAALTGVAAGAATVVHLKNQQAAKKAAEEAAKKSKPLLSKMMGALKNISSPIPFTKASGFAVATVTAVMFREKLAETLPKIMGSLKDANILNNLKDAPSQALKSIKTMLNPAKTPIGEFTTQSQKHIRSAGSVIGELTESGRSIMGELKKSSRTLIKDLGNLTDDLSKIKDYLK